nr:GntR family transcriptional regulator [Paenibacillus pasadenensis]
MPVRISHGSEQPIYVQLRDQIRGLIRSGSLQPSAQLPSLRDLAKQLECSLITVRRVYLDLEREGYLSIQKGVGTFVQLPGAEHSGRRSWSRALVSEAFRSAVGSGIKYGLTPEEMENLLKEMLASYPAQDRH